MSDVILKANGLSKAFHKAGVEFQSYDRLIEIARGEDISIVGQSGSGKSTLLQLLGALDKPLEGHCTSPDRNGVMQEVYSSPQKIDQIHAINAWDLSFSFTICCQITML